MASIFKRDTSTIGTAIGIAVFVIAWLGSSFLGWEWGASGQPIAFVVGGIAAIVAVWFTIQKMRA